jgi:hypothetical protein
MMMMTRKYHFIVNLLARSRSVPYQSYDSSVHFRADLFLISMGHLCFFLFDFHSFDPFSTTTEQNITPILKFHS